MRTSCQSRDRLRRRTSYASLATCARPPANKATRYATKLPSLYMYQRLPSIVRRSKTHPKPTSHHLDNPTQPQWLLHQSMQTTQLPANPRRYRHTIHKTTRVQQSISSPLSILVPVSLLHRQNAIHTGTAANRTSHRLYITPETRRSSLPTSCPSQSPAYRTCRRRRYHHDSSSTRHLRHRL